MSVKQKTYIGGFLILNLWLIVIALVRITSFKQGRIFDFTWTMFFQMFEPNVAILAACFSAFRSLFVNNGHERQVQPHRPGPSFGRRPPGKNASEHYQSGDLPSVPAPTQTGMRTMIWQGNKTKVSNIGSNDTALEPATEGVDEISLEQGFNHRGDRILVEHGWSMESTRVSHKYETFKITEVLIAANRLHHHLVMEHQKAGYQARALKKHIFT